MRRILVVFVRGGVGMGLGWSSLKLHLCMMTWRVASGSKMSDGEGG